MTESNVYRYVVTIKDETQTENLVQRMQKFKAAIKEGSEIFDRIQHLIDTRFYDKFIADTLRELEDKNFELTLPKELETVLYEIRAGVYELLNIDEENGKEILSNIEELLEKDRPINTYDNLLMDKLSAEMSEGIKDEMLDNFGQFKESLLDELSTIVPRISEEEFPFEDPIAELNEMTGQTELNDLMIEKLGNLMSADELYEIIRKEDNTSEILEEILTSKFASEKDFYENLSEDIKEFNEMRKERENFVESLTGYKESLPDEDFEDLHHMQQKALDKRETQLLKVNSRLQLKMEEVRDKIIETVEQRLDATDLNVDPEVKSGILMKLERELSEGIFDFDVEKLQSEESKIKTPQSVLSKIIRDFMKRTSREDVTETTEENDKIRVMSNLNNLLQQFMKEQGGSIRSEEIAEELTTFLKDTEFEFAAEEISERISTLRTKVEVGSVMDLLNAIIDSEGFALEGLKDRLGDSSKRAVDDLNDLDGEDLTIDQIAAVWDMEIGKIESGSDQASENILDSVLSKTDSQTAEIRDYLMDGFSNIARQLDQMERNIKQVVDNTSEETRGFFQRVSSQNRPMPPSPSKMLDMGE